MVHDDKNNRLSSIDTTKLVLDKKLTVDYKTQAPTAITLPIEGEGFWLLKAQADDDISLAYLIRTSLTTVAKEGDGRIIYWVQDQKNHRSVSDAKVRVYNLKNQVTLKSEYSTNSEGVAMGSDETGQDIALVSSGDRMALLPINLTMLAENYSRNRFNPKHLYHRFFVFTDRPLYRPGDIVYFKIIARSEDDARFSLPSGPLRVKIIKDYNYSQPVYDKQLSYSEQGSVNGSYKLPEITGDYYVTVDVPNPDIDETSMWYGVGRGQDTASFQVEHFRKPEYFLSLSTPQMEYVAGDNIPLSLQGEYFSGQGLASQTLKYKVFKSSFYEYDYYEANSWLNDSYRYGFYTEKLSAESTVQTDKKGRAQIDLDSSQPDLKSSTPQIISIEADYDDGSGNPAFARKNIIVYPGYFSIYFGDDFKYQGRVNEKYRLPVKLTSMRGGQISGVELFVNTRVENWVAQPLQPGQKYPNYSQVVSNLPEMKTRTSSDGQAAIEFTPEKSGSYIFTVTGRDHKGNLISKEFNTWISDKDYPVFTDNRSSTRLSLEPDKKTYQPGDTVNLKIWSALGNQDVFLTVERGRVDRYFVVKMDGHTADHSFRLEPQDQPNVFAKAVSFTDQFDTVESQLSISNENKRVRMTLTPDATKFGPGQTVTVNLDTTDQSGNPIPTEAAIWVVDKAIFELANSNLGDIFDNFWRSLYNTTTTANSLESILGGYGAEGGGCFPTGTQILLPNQKSTSIEHVLPGQYVLSRSSPDNPALVSSRVKEVSKTEVDGYLQINDSLKITPDHVLWVNNAWKTADHIQVGDRLLTPENQALEVTSVEWQAGKTTVYNLHLENNHTFFAENVWVHNNKGEGSGRNVFKDTAYWNPLIHTGDDGRVKATFKLPDNLTTWVIAAVAATPDTKVGQTLAEITVSKDIVVRPILPNIVRVGDQIQLSGLVHNFTDQDREFSVNLNYSSADMKSQPDQKLTIPANTFEQFSWPVLINKTDSDAQLTMSASASGGLSDKITVRLPALANGFTQNRGKFLPRPGSHNLNWPSDVSLDNSNLKISLSSTTLGTLPSAMAYLLDYPYGCVEQTTSRLVPLLLAKKYQAIFNSVIESRDIDKMINSGLNRLYGLQGNDGGWSWWSSGSSNPFISAYVVEYLLYARSLGYEIDQTALSQSLEFFKNLKQDNPDSFIPKIYALGLLNEPEGKATITIPDNTPDDLLALAVIHNRRRGSDNGLDQLADRVQSSSSQASWSAGDYDRFGSADASTGLALRALAGSARHHDLAVSAARTLLARHNTNYWSNTYGTVQVARGLLDLYSSQTSAQTNYRYSVYVDDVLWQTAATAPSASLHRDIVIPGSKLKHNSIIRIERSGEGELYTTLTENLWRTARLSEGENHGLKITRNYINDKGSNYSLGLGDTVTVNLTVDLTGPTTPYAVIEDQLPSGLIPINTTFKNEQAIGQSYDNATREYTENGVVISPWYLNPGVKTFSYKARVVAVGEFDAPPAQAQLMYQPEVYGYSNTETVKVTADSVWHPDLSGRLSSPIRNLVKTSYDYLVFIIPVALSGVIVAAAVYIKRRSKR